MSKHQKLITRLLSVPKDYTWDELVSVLNIFGYSEFNKGKTGCSRRRFVDTNNHVITLHKPHPKNILKEYALKQVIIHLKEKGYFKDE